MIKFSKVLLATAALGVGLLTAFQANADQAWTSVTNVGMNKRSTGVDVKQVTLVSGTNTVSQALPVDCDANGVAYIKSSAATSDSGTLAVGPSPNQSSTIYTATTSLTPSPTFLIASHQCFVWCKITPLAGSTQTTTCTVQTEDTQRRNRPGL